jgi:hypothetical protein
MAFTRITLFMLLSALASGQNIVTEMSSDENVELENGRLKFYARDRGRPDHEAHDCVVMFSGKLRKADTCFTEDAPVLLAKVPNRIPLLVLVDCYGIEIPKGEPCYLTGQFQFFHPFPSLRTGQPLAMIPRASPSYRVRLPAASQ